MRNLLRTQHQRERFISRILFIALGLFIGALVVYERSRVIGAVVVAQATEVRPIGTFTPAVVRMAPPRIFTKRGKS